MPQVDKNKNVKAILIFVVICTTAILFVLKLRDFKESKAIEKAKSEYQTYTAEKIEGGSLLDIAQLQEQINQKFESFVIEEEVFKSYLAIEGYTFNLTNLTRKKGNGEEGEEALFSSTAPAFGAKETAGWRVLLSDPVSAEASESLVALKATRALREWEVHLDQLNESIYNLSKKNSHIGLGFAQLRPLSAIDRDSIYSKIEGFYKANCSYGRLQLSKGKSSQPYDIALDLIALQNMAFAEATEAHEVSLVLKLEKVLLDYIDYIGAHNPSVKFLGKVQLALANYEALDTYFSNDFNRFRSTLKQETEERFDTLTKRRRMSDDFLDETFILTEHMRYKSLFLIYNAAEKLALNPSKGTLNETFNAKSYQDFKEYVEKEFFQKEDDEVYIQHVLPVLNSISKKVYDYAEIRLKRDKSSTLMAVERYKMRTGEYPKSLSEITGYDQPYDIKNIITGKAYEGSFVQSETEGEAGSEKSFTLHLTLGSDHLLK